MFIPIHNQQSKALLSLGNGNFVINQPYHSGVASPAGRVTLVNGTTGAQLSSLTGPSANYYLGYNGIARLNNNNYVISSQIANASTGSIILLDGSSGAQIGSTINGNASSDSFGAVPVVALTNNNYLMINSHDRLGTAATYGSMAIVNGDTGMQVGSKISSTALNAFHNATTVELPNGNLVVASRFDDTPGAYDLGSVRLINSSTGVEISIEYGNDNDDGNDLNVFALANNNYLIVSPKDDIGSITDAGSVKLMNGTTGAFIARIRGTTNSDEIGSSIALLADNRIAIISPKDDSDSIADAGSMRLMDGVTGAQISLFEGASTGDFIDAKVTPVNDTYYMLGAPKADVEGKLNSGFVLQNYYPE